MNKDLSHVGLQLRALREGARLSIPRASTWLGVSVGHMWNVEMGLSAFTTEQESSLRAFYGTRILDQLNTLAKTLDSAI
jgi:predicted transcriptional regulator